MDDRELLEFAAKSHGGIDYYKISSEGMHLKGGGVWSPLQNGGDALRLAVALQLEIRPGTGAVSVSNICYRDPLSFVWYDGNPNAATRRAIVKAAARIWQETNNDQ